MHRRAKGKRFRPKLFRSRPTLWVPWPPGAPHERERALLLSAYSRSNCLGVTLARDDLAGFPGVTSRVFECAYHVLARDHPYQLAVRPDNWKAAALKTHHQLENSR